MNGGWTSGCARLRLLSCTNTPKAWLDDDWRHAAVARRSMFPPVSESDLDYQIYESSILLGCGCYSPQVVLPASSAGERKKRSRLLSPISAGCTLVSQLGLFHSTGTCKYYGYITASFTKIKRSLRHRRSFGQTSSRHTTNPALQGQREPHHPQAGDPYTCHRSPSIRRISLLVTASIPNQFLVQANIFSSISSILHNFTSPPRSIDNVDDCINQ
jgi:hypothetical protein